MYKFMMIMLMLVVSMSSSSLAVGLQYGTILTIGGKKMIVVSQENEEVKLKPYVFTKAEKPKTHEAVVKIVKPEWDSKTVVTEGVKNVQECLNPSGCPQDTKTGECLEGCPEQKVHVEMTETIVDPEVTKPVAKVVSDVFDHDLLLHAFLRIDADSFGGLRRSYKEYYGKPEWICVMINVMHSKQTKLELSKLLYSNPKFLKICNTEFAHNAGANQWTILQRIHSF